MFGNLTVLHVDFNNGPMTFSKKFHFERFFLSQCGCNTDKENVSLPLIIGQNE